MFGQLVIGAPGSGKTTYCQGLQQLYEQLNRKTAIINLDPANDALPYEASADISELVCLESVQQKIELGPNGGLIYCMEYLEQNLDWLEEKIIEFRKSDCYIVIDCPGQCELFSHSISFQNIIKTMVNKWNVRLAAVSLIDCSHCIDGPKYVSGLLQALSSMLHLELPHINVLSKLDLIQQMQSSMDFDIEYYLECSNLQYLLHSMEQGHAYSHFYKKHRKLTEDLVDVVDGFGLVGFTPLAIENKKQLVSLQRQIDIANGYAFLDPASFNESFEGEDE